MAPGPHMSSHACVTAPICGMRQCHLSLRGPPNLTLKHQTVLHRKPPSPRRCAEKRVAAQPMSAVGEQPPSPEGVTARVATEGDIVTIHYTLSEEDGTLLDSSRQRNEPITFEVGAGELFANELYQAFDAVVRGLGVGEKTVLQAQGSDWQRDLLFTVPRDHPEVQRLEGRYKSVGGLAEGLVVELANGKPAAVVELTDEVVRLDANAMLAGKTRFFELELIAVEPPALDKP